MKDQAWTAVMKVAWGGLVSIAREASDALAYVNGFASFDQPATAKLIKVELPILNAFEAGLFVYWITPREVTCVPQPRLWIDMGVLHRADGPAVAWP